MPEYHTASAEETIALGRAIGRRLQGGQIIAFTGGLGAGKTTLCRGIAEGLGLSGQVSSPTFSIVNVYEGPVRFAHFDAYRIATEQDLETAGFYDYLDEGAVVAVEWSENIRPYLPPGHIQIDIQTAGESAREIRIQGMEGIDDSGN